MVDSRPVCHRQKQRLRAGVPGAHELDINAGDMVTDHLWRFTLHHVPYVLRCYGGAIRQPENAIRQKEVLHLVERRIFSRQNAISMEDLVDLGDGDGPLNGTGLVQVGHVDLVLSF